MVQDSIVGSRPLGNSGVLVKGGRVLRFTVYPFYHILSM